MLRRLSFLAAFALAACSGAWAQEPVRIGFSLAKTGLFATATPAQLNAYPLLARSSRTQRAVSMSPAAGVRVEFVEYDDQSSTANTVKIYEKLITDDKVDLLLSPWGTPSQLAVVPVLEKFGFPMVGNTASSVLVRELKVKNLWFVSPSMHDRLAPAGDGDGSTAEGRQRRDHRQHPAAG